MPDRTEACRPEQRSAIIAYELRKYSIDVAALSEVRYHGCGSIKEEAAGFIIEEENHPLNQSWLMKLSHAVKSLSPRCTGNPKQ